METMETNALNQILRLAQAFFLLGLVWFLSQPVLMQGGLLGAAFRLPVCPSVCLWLDKNYWTIIHISWIIWVGATKFGVVMNVDDV